MSDIPKAQEQLFDRRRSAREKYQALVVGRPGWWPLIRHELVALVSQATPGALGLLLRKWFYPRLLGSCGTNVVFGQGVVLRHPHKIRIGSDVVIDDGCLLDAKGGEGSGISIGDRVFVGRNTILSCKNGSIELRDGANIGFNCEVFSASRVVVGAHALVAAYCYLIGGDHDFSDPTVPIQALGRSSKGIEVGEGSWLGAGVLVLDGVRIGSRAIVGAGSVVKVDVPDLGVAASRPAKLVGTRSEHE